MDFGFRKYKVICESCKGSDTLTISSDNKQVMYDEHLPIISARFRPDLKWGFECTCGQDSRVSPQEINTLDRIVKGGEHSIATIKKSLTKNNELKFRMEQI